MNDDLSEAAKWLCQQEQTLEADQLKERIEAPKASK